MAGAPESPLTLAEHYLSVSRPDRCLEVLADAGGDAAEAPVAWLLRSLAFHEMTRHDEARLAAEKGLSLAPDWPPLRMALGMAHREGGDLAEAERAFLAALRDDPENPTLLCEYAMTVAEATQLDKADRLLERAAALEPGSTHVVEARMKVAHLRGDTRAAEALSQQLLAADADNPSGQMVHGITRWDAGDVNAADRSIRSAAVHPGAQSPVAQLAREAQLAAHPLMWPVRPLYRIGMVPFWIGAMVIFFGLRFAGLDAAAVLFAGAYLAYCIYTWVVPPLLRRWLARRRFR